MSTITFSSIPMYAVKDAMADEFGPPFCAKNDKVAERMFNQLTKEVEKKSDYLLMRIGSFDPVTGVVSSCEQYAVYDDPVAKTLGVFPEAKEVSENA